MVKKWFPWIDLIFFGSIAIIAVALSILAASTQQEWDIGKIVVLIVTPIAFTGLAIVIVVYKWFSKPDFTTKHGTYVWRNNISGLTKIVVEKALDFFVEQVPLFYPNIKPAELEGMLQDAKIEFRDGGITLYAIGWDVRDKSGLQQGRAIMVKWNGSIVESAFFHELMHVVDEIIFHKEPDYKHENLGWWNFEGVLNSDFTKKFGYIG